MVGFWVFPARHPLEFRQKISGQIMAIKYPGQIIKWLVIWMLFQCLTIATGAYAGEKRLALVVGVANYKFTAPLKNTINDANLIGSRLSQLGFDVQKLINPSLLEFRQTLKRFAFEAETADVAFVYFAGHGVEYGGINYLIPVDTKARNRTQINAHSVSLEELLESVDGARRIRVVILDSCRNDPFIDENTGKANLEVVDASNRRSGLAPADPERGTLVAFAQEAGKVAADGDGDNSPYAMSLAKHLVTPDLEIGLMFRRVRDSVLRSTGNSQNPHTYGALPGVPFFLAGKSQEANQLVANERKNAWSSLAPDQEVQMVALAVEGDTRAMLGLAYMRLNPEEENYSPKQAFSLLKRAAKKGNNDEAIYELGRLYEKGIGTDQNVAKAIELYRRAAILNNADAINDLGFLYYQGGLGIARDPQKALKYFERAADLKHPQASFNFAALVDDGLVKEKGPEDSARYLFSALRSGAEDVLKVLSDNPKMFKRETLRQLQKQLALHEFYTGAIDGVVGPGTQRGLKRAYGINE